VRLHLTFAASAEAPVLARHEVAACPAIPGMCRDDLELLVSEVVTNAVRHAGRGPGSPIEVEADCSDEEVRVVVRDGGDGIPAPRAPGDDGGFGLHIVDRVAAAWGAGPGELWFVVRPPEPAL
jgi:anti-sigma regulatory factor (Ser/Thr protein kinase)